MACRELHGLVIEHRCEAGEDPAGLLLGLLPEAAPGAAPDLVIETTLATDARALEPAGEVVFTLREVALRSEDGKLTVTYPGVVVHLEGTRLGVVLRAPLDGDAAWAFSQLPLLLALLATLRPRGLHHLHAGALVAPDGRSLVVAGETGSGKSTLTAALVLAGCGFLGDDVVLVRGATPVRPSTTFTLSVGSAPPRGAGRSRRAQDERTKQDDRRETGRPVLLSFPRAFHLSEAAVRAISHPSSSPPQGGGYARDGRLEGEPAQGGGYARDGRLEGEPAHGDGHGRERSGVGPPQGGGYARGERLKVERLTARGRLALDPRTLFPGRERRDGPAPSALVFPRVADREDTVLRPLSGADALGRLVESSALVAVKAIPGAREQLALLGQLVDGARAFEAELGRDLLLDAARTAGRVLGEALP
jgi:hypothetical protein